jgi:hypothetical protein
MVGCVHIEDIKEKTQSMTFAWGETQIRTFPLQKIPNVLVEGMIVPQPPYY